MNRTYKIDVPKRYLLIPLILQFLFIVGAVLILSFNNLMNVQYKILINFIGILICLPAAYFISANITLFPDYIFINSGMFYFKKIKYSDINEVHTVDPDTLIPRFNPVFTKNIVAIEYASYKTVYVSLKTPKEFVDDINNIKSKVKSDNGHL